ncbi:probable G-protein coupled receptor Mth-like 7 [Drosophila subpulchrella]|uniref:probable G-protein coupled receptor Mth-like 7 n=1 Tax=Drosophila subpulchrella TaxID=1486046 RepID=UPI0018A15BC3|nr:probable G-protein coupled receptor Mth-like 7 [Drosophila subpulchrella]
MERQNGSYQYEGIVIPDNLIGEYGFKMVPFEQRLTVKTHLRGCVCELRTCIRICCPRKNMLPNGGCSDGLNDQLLQVNPHLYVNNEDDTLSDLYLNNQTLLRTQLWGEDRMVYLLGDQYTLYKNGTLILNYQNMELKKEEYCLHPNQFKSRYSAGLWFVLHETTVIPLPGVLGIYISVKKLRNVLGKCLICSMLSLFMTDLSFLIDEYRFLSNVCLLAGYCSYFFDFAFILWNSVISYHLWKTLTSVNRDEPRQRFLAYSAFVWVTAAIPTGAIFMINQIWVNDLNNWNWMPLVGFSRCAVDIFKKSAWIYYHGPLLILNIFIFIMFILTARNILKVKRKLKKIAHRRDGTTTCFNFNSEK